MANRASNLLPLAALAVALMPTGALGAARTAYDVAGASALGVATRSAGLTVKVAGASASDVWRAPDASGDSTLWAYEVPSMVAARDIVPRAVPSGAAVDSTAALLSGRALGGQDLTVLRHAYDADAEVMLARARMLDPGLGTFLQRDPEGYTDSVNQYAAMANDPVNNRDPTGRVVVDPNVSMLKAVARAAKTLLLTLGQTAGHLVTGVEPGADMTQLGYAQQGGLVVYSRCAGPLADGQVPADVCEWAKNAAKAETVVLTAEVLAAGAGVALQRRAPRAAPAQSRMLIGDARLSVGAMLNTTDPEVVAARAARDEQVTLYRGVPRGHPKYQDATQGRAVPLGGTATPYLHNLGDTESEYTSWTDEPSLARAFAVRSRTDGGLSGEGVVLQTRVPRSRLIRSPDAAGEGEQLIPGVLEGAKVTPVKGPGY